MTKKPGEAVELARRRDDDQADIFIYDSEKGDDGHADAPFYSWRESSRKMN